MGVGWVARLVRLRAAGQARWGLLALVLAALAWPAGAPALAGEAPAAGPPAAGVDIQTLERAQFCLIDDSPPAEASVAAIPGEDCRWQPVALAHVWTGHHGDGTSDAWFRMHFTLPAVPAQGVALYIMAFNRSGVFFVNGHYMRELGAMREPAPLPLNWNRAQYAVMPPVMLQAGDNVLDIHQRIYWWESGWLTPVRIGPEDVLRPVYESRRFWQNDLVRMLGTATGAIGIMMLGVWLGRREHAMYFWCGCTALAWTAISLDYFALVPPLPALAWEGFMEAAQVLRAVLMFIFVLRYCGRREPVLETILWAYVAIGSIVLFGRYLPGRYVDAWYLLALLASPYFLVLLVREGLRRSRLEGVLLGIAALAQIVLSAYDLWIFSRHTWTDRVYLAHFSAPLVLFVAGWSLMRRFIASLDNYEKLAAVLEKRIAAKAGELEHNYEQLMEARRNEAIALERTRIMSEMHDGIGSQLTLALSLVRDVERERNGGVAGEDGRVATVLRESIEDLQLIIDSLEPVENDLLTVLGTLRYRLHDRLSKSGIDLQWNVVDLPPLPMLTPHGVLSILRIVQEAFANCIKHSEAARIVVSTALDGTPGVDETACIRIVDDGRGIAGSRVGRGLENMRRRAEALGGRLLITSRPGGTEVLLAIPTLRAAP